ncbi:bifunctional transcriptional activator/DNA repair enzyme AdaA [uncultured Aquimarina sp.]|uniref:bifunctional transcriptional activator/DNA repair enzyme AdaA n=1 Tax=uncultured Aquimarina sp. TaxID=575652 RepID=UPI00260C4347|nr:bifunctional transcriptional activator/DNA repair protein Ada [uncultured Aquimarina sp.]
MLITENKTIEIYYKALLERKESFVGIFFVGVKTTSVFCIATCRARKPKLENVEFYTSFKEALDHGYRPCKICKPTENANEAPEQVEKAIALIKQHPKEKITDDQLRKLAISPEVVRRWFKKNYGMTFQSYQRMYRINNAFQELKKGKNATHTAFDSGYESLSGFGYTFKKVIGNSPLKSIHKNVILISRLTTPLGPMFVCATKKGICLLEFVDRRMLETEFTDLQKRLEAQIIAGENEHIKQAKKEITEYFNGKRKIFDVAIESPGTEFQKRVWHSLKEIEYGKVTTYKQQAEKINNPKAVRAVAAANGCNRISIIIPCHRVIGKDGSMTGYSGGVERKKWLLTHENEHL